MIKGKINEIIQSYIDNETPEEVKDAFQRWLLDDDSSDEKDAALSNIWNNLSLAETESPEDPYKILKEAQDIETSEASKKIRRRNHWLVAISALAACMTVFAIIGWTYATGSVTCLASSENSKAEFLLPDGSKVWLNKNSRVTFRTSLLGKQRMVSLEGEGYFDVAHDSNRPFVVDASGLTVKVLGTIFTVSAYEDEAVRVFLEEGSVMASAPGHQDIVLSPNHAVIYDPQAGSFETFEENATDHTAWIDGRLDFVNKPLSEILDCLEHWYGINIVCNDMNKASRIRLSMVIRQEPIEEILEAICAIAQVSYITDSKGDIKLSFEK